MPITVYTYGAKPPVDERAAVDILFHAHRYRNKLVELKRDRAVCVALAKLPGAKLSDEAIRELYNLEIRAAYAECPAHYGTKALSRQAASKAKKFARWDGTGRIGAPLNGSSATIPVVALNRSAGLRITPNGKFFQVMLAQGKDKPAVNASIKMHRPLPVDGIIRAAWLQRRRIGTHFKWELQLSVETQAPSSSARPNPGRAIALDLGWRGSREKLQKGRRAGKLIFTADDGTRIQLSHTWFSRARKASDVQSIRDKAFNAHKPHSNMRAPARLAKRVRAGEFPELEAWRAQDRHLADWAAFQRTNCLLSRREQYRLAAVELCRRADTIYIEAFDLRKVATKESGGADRKGRVACAPAECRNAIKARAAKTGVRVVEVPRQWTSRVCTRCGATGAKSSEEVLTCERCSAVEDRDIRAAKNIRKLGMWLDQHADRSHSDMQDTEILRVLGAE